jgi:hypothetical protein
VTASQSTPRPGTCCAASAAGARSAGDCCCTPTASSRVQEWQQWHTVTRKAIRKHAIGSVTDLGTPDGRVAYHLIYAHCRRRISSGASPALLPGLQP